MNDFNRENYRRIEISKSILFLLSFFLGTSLLKKSVKIICCTVEDQERVRQLLLKAIKFIIASFEVFFKIFWNIISIWIIAKNHKESFFLFIRLIQL